MSFITTIRNAIEDMFVPRDGLYDQARELISQHDPDGNWRVDVSAVHSGQIEPLPGLFGITHRGFARADAEGNGDGQASIREVRNFLKKYDIGDGFNPGTAGDKTIDGIELLRILADLWNPTPASAREQASDGARQLS